MTAEVLAQFGGLIGACGAALLLVATGRNFRLAALAVWGLGLALMVPLLAPEGETQLLLAGGLLAMGAVAGLTVLLVRHPWTLPFLTLAATPARIPVTVGETSANLLLPLYVIIGAGAIALAWSIWREPERTRELGPLAWPVALLVLWLGASALWTSDVRSGAIELFFYILPLSVLAAALARLRWSAERARMLRGLLVAMAVLFAAIGIWQWATDGVFWNEKVISSNEFKSFYRVNSVFWDPSIYGRFVVLALIVCLALILFGRGGRPLLDLMLGLAIVVLCVGLLFSYSQSSFVALAFGVFVTALVAWRWRALVALAVAVAVMIPPAIAAPQLDGVRDRIRGDSPTDVTRVTSHRSRLVSGGLEIAWDHPLIGVGVGGFVRAYQEETESTRRQSAASHTTPVTVLAEAGVVGFILYVWFLVAGLWLGFRRIDLSSPAGRAQVVAGICLAVLAVHSIFYGAFFEDPLTWGFAALAVVAARARGVVDGSASADYSSKSA